MCKILGGYIMSKTIEQLVSVLKNVEVRGSLTKEVEFIAHDSRRVRKNTLFVCISGTRVDGVDGRCDEALKRLAG